MKLRSFFPPSLIRYVPRVGDGPARAVRPGRGAARRGEEEEERARDGGAAVAAAAAADEEEDDDDDDGASVDAGRRLGTAGGHGWHMLRSHAAMWILYYFGGFARSPTCWIGARRDGGPFLPDKLHLACEPPPAATSSVATTRPRPSS